MQQYENTIPLGDGTFFDPSAALLPHVIINDSQANALKTTVQEYWERGGSPGVDVIVEVRTECEITLIRAADYPPTSFKTSVKERLPDEEGDQ